MKSSVSTILLSIVSFGSILVDASEQYSLLFRNSELTRDVCSKELDLIQQGVRQEIREEADGGRNLRSQHKERELWNFCTPSFCKTGDMSIRFGCCKFFLTEETEPPTDATGGDGGRMLEQVDTCHKDNICPGVGSYMAKMIYEVAEELPADSACRELILDTEYDVLVNSIEN